MKRKYLIFITLISVAVGFVFKTQKVDRKGTAETTKSEFKKTQKRTLSNVIEPTVTQPESVSFSTVQATGLPATPNRPKIQPKKRQNQFALYKSDRFSSLLSFELPEFKIEEREINGKNYSIIQSEGKNRPLNNKGLPALPVFKQELLIPVGSTPRLVINKNSFREIEMENPPVPGVGPIFRKQKIPEPEKGNFYSSNEIYPKSEVRMSRSFKFRGLEAVTVFVSPYRYDSGKKVLRIYDNINFSVQTADSEEILLSKPLTVRDFVRSAEESFINYEEAGNEYLQSQSRSLPVPEKGKMLIVTPTKFLPAIGEFIQWKKQIGFTVDTYTYNNEGIDSLRSAIQRKINSGTSHVILMGDYAEIPARRFKNTGKWTSDKTSYIESPLKDFNNIVLSDLYYAGVDPVNNDYVQDCFISRISTSSINELTTQLHKLICYERGESFYSDTGAWLRSVLLAASDDGGYGAYKNRKDYEHIIAQKSILSRLIFNNFTESYENSLSMNNFKDRILDALNQNSALSYYLGHGATNGWASVKYQALTFQSSDLSHLTAELPTLSIQSVCQTGCFYTNCFAEQQMSSPAFCGVLAGTNNTLWNPPMVQVEELTANLEKDTYETVGGLLSDSVQQAVHWSNSNAGGFVRDMTAAQLHYFGDCSMGFRTKSPKMLKIEILNEVKQGDGLSVKITVNNQVAVGIDVSLMFNGTVTAKETDSEGIVDFSVLDQDGMYTITAWGRNYVVAQEIVSIGSTVVLKGNSFTTDQEVANLKALINGTNFSVDSADFYIENGILKAVNSFDLSSDLEIKVNYTKHPGARADDAQIFKLNVTPSYNKGYKFEINQGWNLIGLPVTSQKTAAELLKDSNGNSLLNSNLYYWPYGATDYIQSSTSEKLTEQLGFWIHSNQNKVSAEFSGRQTRGIMTDLKTGWNLYSPAMEHSPPSGTECVWCWDSVTQSYRSCIEEKLSPTIGYWVFMID